jgi:hypothetical protein
LSFVEQGGGRGHGEGTGSSVDQKSFEGVSGECSSRNAAAIYRCSESIEAVTGYDIDEALDGT